MTYHAALNGLQPYLHESRHIHALNRVRGSGGRFLSKKKLQESDPTPSQCNVTDTIHSHVKNDASELESYQSGTGQSGASNTTCSDITSVSYSNVTFRQPERRFSGIATHLGGGMEINSRLICRGTQHHTSVVQWKYGRRPCNRSGNSSLASSLLLRTKCARRTLLCIWSLWGLLFFFFCLYILGHVKMVGKSFVFETHHWVTLIVKYGKRCKCFLIRLSNKRSDLGLWSSIKPHISKCWALCSVNTEVGVR